MYLIIFLLILSIGLQLRWELYFRIVSQFSSRTWQLSLTHTEIHCILYQFHSEIKKKIIILLWRLRVRTCIYLLHYNIRWRTSNVCSLLCVDPMLNGVPTYDLYRTLQIFYTLSSVIHSMRYDVWYLLWLTLVTSIAHSTRRCGISSRPETKRSSKIPNVLLRKYVLRPNLYIPIYKEHSRIYSDISYNHQR